MTKERCRSPHDRNPVTFQAQVLMLSKFDSGSVQLRQNLRIWSVTVLFEPNLENIIPSCSSLSLLLISHFQPRVYLRVQKPPATWLD